MEGDPSDRARDFAAAGLFILIGVGAVLIGRDYPLGTPHRIGPGVLPLGVGLLMIAVGAVLAVQAWLRGAEAGPLLIWPTPTSRAVRAVVFVTLSLLAFALLIRPLGLFAATAALVVIARQAEAGATLIGTLVLALTLALLCAAIFVWGIGLPFRLWPAWG